MQVGHNFKRDFSLSAGLAGMVTLIVAVAGPNLLLFKVAQTPGVHLTDAQLASWLWASSLGSGLVSIFASLRYRQPIIATWSTPGLALLAGSLPGMPFGEAVGAFMASNLLIAALGWSGLFDRLMAHIPMAIAAALLAGILFPFELDVCRSLQTSPGLVGAMLLSFVLVRALASRWAISAVLVVGLIVAALSGQVHGHLPRMAWTQPLWTNPSWSWHAFINIALPMALVTLAGQYLSGFAVLKASGYQPPANALTRLLSGVSVLIAPFGCHAICPSSMLSAIVVGPDAHPDPRRRYVAGVISGAAVMVFGLFAGSITALVKLLPEAIVATLSGLALLGAVTHALGLAMAHAEERDAAIMTFIVTVAGVEFLGLGSAFWGLLAGLAVRVSGHLLSRASARSAASPNAVATPETHP